MKTVLLAYEREQDFASVETLLQARGHRVLRARSGTEAIDSIRRDTPEVVIADVMLPRLDGFALCRRIKEDDLLRHLPVLLHSCRVEGPKYEAFAVEVGAERFLPRGSSLEELARMVDEASPLVRPAAAVVELEQSRERDRQQLEQLEQRAHELQLANLKLHEAEREAREAAEQATRASDAQAQAGLERISTLQSRIRDLEVAQQKLLETEQRALGIARETRAEAGKVSVLEMRLAELQATRATALAARSDADRVFAGLPTPTWITDIETGKVTMLSESAAALFGCSAIAAAHRAQADLLPAITLGGEAAWPRRGVLPRSDGSRVTLEFERVAVSYSGRACWLMSARDVSAEQASTDAAGAMLHMERVMLGLVGALAVVSELQDACKAGRTTRVAELSAAIGRSLGLDAHSISSLRVIAQLLDVGMIYVPRELLWRSGTLTPAEFDLVKTHPERGFELLRRVEFPWPVAEAVRQHHERLDGSGYPRGLCGEEIMLEARIVAVADAVDAMLSARPHRPALRLEACLTELQSQAGRRYDERVVRACVQILRERDQQLAVAASEGQRVA